MKKAIILHFSVVVFFVLALGFGGLMDQLGVIKVISDILGKWAKKIKPKHNI